MQERDLLAIGLTDMAGIERWQDWTSFALGLWLALSPWVAGYAEHASPTANAAFCGTALALAAHFEASCCEDSIEWANLALGLWLVAAPFVLGFDSQPVAAVTSASVGAFVAGLAASALELDRGLSRWVQRRIVSLHRPWRG